MKKIANLSILMSCIWLASCGGGSSATGVTSPSAEVQKVNDKIILVLQPSIEQLAWIASATGELKTERIKQVQADLMQPLSEAKLREIAAAARRKIIDYAPFALGGRVLAFDHNLSDAEMNQALLNIKNQVSGVKEIEADQLINTASVAPEEITTVNQFQWYLYNTVQINTSSNPFILPLPPFYGSGFFNGTTKFFVNSTGDGVTIAVLDTGYVPHPDFTSNLQELDNQGNYGYTFLEDCYTAGECPADTPIEQRYLAPHANALETGVNTNKAYEPANWHGSHVTGLIIAQGLADAGDVAYGPILGGAPSAKVVPVRVLGKNGSYLSDVMNGMLWAANLYPTITNPNPAQILNLSLTFSGACSTMMQQIVDEIHTQNISIVAAAGNNGGVNIANKSPVSCSNVISVASVTPSRTVSAFSNIGNVTIAAPGGALTIYTDPKTGKSVTGYASLISTTYVGTEYGKCTAGAKCFNYTPMAGTSQATPLVSAALADILALHPNLTTTQLTEIITNSADPLEYGSTSLDGAGTLNVANALELANDPKYN